MDYPNFLKAYETILSKQKEIKKMFEKVNPCHPDKVADRIAGALVDLAYQKETNPRIAVEVLIGHGDCAIIAETSVSLDKQDVCAAVERISGIEYVTYKEVSQDCILSANQAEEIRCGDNGIFKGVPTNDEEKELLEVAKFIFGLNKSDGKYIINGEELIVCQSNTDSDILRRVLEQYGYEKVKINPLGDWTGGTDVDSGATNRKLGSDMGRAVTGGGLHGKDLSKADVSVNIYAFLKAQETGEEVNLCCAIGDTTIDGKPYSEIVKIARDYIDKIGGFEKFAEWGLINV